MSLNLKRCFNLELCTLGGLYVDEHFQCFTLEDAAHDVKIPGETRIPAGVFELKLRTEGRVNAQYAARFTDHRGMIWLQNIPDFEWVYLHCGNTAEDTDGCILVGDSLQASGKILDSVQAYRRVYNMIANAILAGEPASISIVDG